MSRHKAVLPTAVGPVMTMSVLADDTSLRAFDERADILYLLHIGILGASLGHTILHDGLGVDDAISIVDGIDGLVRETTTTQAYEVDTSIADGLLAGNDEGWNILRGAATALEHDVAAHADELMEQTACRDNGEVIDLYLAGNLGGVADDAAIADDTVVGDVHVLHQQIAITHNCLATGGCAARDGNILTDGVIIANHAKGFLALELQVLGFGGNGGTGEELVAIADAGSEVERYVVQQFIVIAQLYVLIDDAERADHIVIAQLCLWVNNS